jgi:hypothetical protein
MLMQKCFRKSKLGMPASNTCKSQEASDSVYRTQEHRHPGIMASSCQVTINNASSRVYHNLGCWHQLHVSHRRQVTAYIVPRYTDTQVKWHQIASHRQRQGVYIVCT